MADSLHHTCLYAPSSDGALCASIDDPCELWRDPLIDRPGAPILVRRAGRNSDVSATHYLGASFEQLAAEFIAGESSQARARWLAETTSRAMTLLGITAEPDPGVSLAHEVAHGAYSQCVSPATYRALDAPPEANEKVITLQPDRARLFQKWLNAPVPAGQPIELGETDMPGSARLEWAEGLGIPVALKGQVTSRPSSRAIEALIASHGGWHTPPFWKAVSRATGDPIHIEQAQVFERLSGDPRVSVSTPYAALSPAWGLACEALWAARAGSCSPQHSQNWNLMRHDEKVMAIAEQIDAVAGIRIVGVAGARLYLAIDAFVGEQHLEEMATRLAPQGYYAVTPKRAYVDASAKESAITKPLAVNVARGRAHSWEQADRFVMAAEYRLTDKA